MIKKIRLRNWRSHLDSEFEFSEGVNALIGIMGSGKTSVLQAISFALFGSFPQLQSKKLRLSDMIMKKPQRKERAEVELDLAANGKAYRIKRVIEHQGGSAKTTHAEIRDGENLIEVTPEGVTRVVEGILQADYDLFSKAIYSEQDGLDAFLRLPKGHRMEQIDRMLRLDMYEAARENAVGLMNRVRQAREGKLKILSDLEKEGVEKRAGDAEKNLNEMREAVYKLKAEHKAISAEKARLEKEVSGAEKREAELNDIRKKLEGLSSGMKEISAAIDQRRLAVGDAGVNVKAVEEQLVNIGKQIRFLENGVREERKEEKAISEAIATLRANIFNLERRVIPDLEVRIKRKEGDAEKFSKLKSALGENPEENFGQRAKALEMERKELYSLQVKASDIRESLRHIEDRRKCPVCETVLTAPKKAALAKKREKQVGVIEGQISLKESIIGGLEREIESLREGVQEFGILRDRVKDIEDMKKSLEASEAQHRKYTGELDAAEKKAPEHERRREKLERNYAEAQKMLERTSNMLKEAKLLEELVAKKKQYESSLFMLGEREKTLAVQAEGIDIRALRRGLEKAIAKEREVFIRVSALSDKVSYTEKSLGELQERRELLERYRKETGRDNEIAESLGAFVKALKATQFQLREEFLATVNYIMGMVWPELYPYSDLESVRLVVQDDYVLQLKEANNWVPVDIASGGERSLAVLALRIAFSLAFTPHLKWLILDEPTHNLDVNAIQNFAEILRERISQFANQVFLITHEDRICEGITGSIYRLERDKESNSATVVVGM